MADPTIRERLRELAEKINDEWCERSKSGLLCERHDRALFPTLSPRCNGWAEQITALVRSFDLNELDDWERRAIAATEALKRLSDVGWVLARITPEGERIEPPDGTWHDLDAALEQARAALEASRGSA